MKHQPFGARQAVAHIDTRQPTSMWQLLVWTYNRRHENVRAAGEPPPNIGPWRRLAPPELPQIAFVHFGERRGSATLLARASAHPDANVVNWAVERMLGHGEDYYEFVRRPQHEQPFDWNPYLPPPRTEKVLNVRGQEKKIYADARDRDWLEKLVAEGIADGIPTTHSKRNKNGEPVASVVKVVGYNDSERAKQLAKLKLKYIDWWISLRILKDVLTVENNLRRWKITEVGLPLEPWASEITENERRSLDGV